MGNQPGAAGPGAAPAFAARPAGPAPQGGFGNFAKSKSDIVTSSAMGNAMPRCQSDLVTSTGMRTQLDRQAPQFSPMAPVAEMEIASPTPAGSAFQAAPIETWPPSLSTVCPPATVAAQRAPMQQARPAVAAPAFASAPQTAVAGPAFAAAPQIAQARQMPLSTSQYRPAASPPPSRPATYASMPSTQVYGQGLYSRPSASPPPASRSYASPHTSMPAYTGGATSYQQQPTSMPTYSSMPAYTGGVATGGAVYQQQATSMPMNYAPPALQTGTCSQARATMPAGRGNFPSYQAPSMSGAFQTSSVSAPGSVMTNTFASPMTSGGFGGGFKSYQQPQLPSSLAGFGGSRTFQPQSATAQLQQSSAGLLFPGSALPGFSPFGGTRGYNGGYANASYAPGSAMPGFTPFGGTTGYNSGYANASYAPGYANGYANSGFRSVPAPGLALPGCGGSSYAPMLQCSNFQNTWPSNNAWGSGAPASYLDLAAARPLR